MTIALCSYVSFDIYDYVNNVNNSKYGSVSKKEREAFDLPLSQIHQFICSLDYCDYQLLICSP